MKLYCVCAASMCNVDTLGAACIPVIVVASGLFGIFFNTGLQMLFSSSSSSGTLIIVVNTRDLFVLFFHLFLVPSLGKEAFFIFPQFNRPQAATCPGT